MVLAPGWMQTPWGLDFWMWCATGYFSTSDVTTTTAPYRGRLVRAPTVTRRVPDALNRMVEHQDVEWELMQFERFDLTPFVSRGFRGRRALIFHYDPDLGSAQTLEWAGRISTTEILASGNVRQRATNVDLGVFTTLVPKVLVNTVDFPLAVDIGRAIPVPCGAVRLLKLPYVNEDTGSNFYDYLAGHGDISIPQVYQEETNKATGPSFSVVPASSYTVSTSLYPGYTSIRFTVKRTNATGGLVGIWADVVNNDERLRHPITCAEVLLSNATWGLGQTTNASVFDAQALVLDAWMGTPEVGFAFGADGHQRAAREWFRQLLMIGATRLVADPITGNWDVTVDTPPSSMVMHLRDGSGHGPRNLKSPGRLVHTSGEDRIRRMVVRYGRNGGTGRLAYETLRDEIDTEGRTETVENECISDHATADRLAAYLGWRKKDHEEQVRDVVMLEEGRPLIEGQLVGYTYAPFGMAAAPSEVIEVTKPLKGPGVDLARWTPRRYQYQAATFPPDFEVDIVPPGAPPTPPSEDVLDSVTCSPPGLLVPIDAAYHQIAGAPHTASGTLDIVAGSGNTLSATAQFTVTAGFTAGAITIGKLKITDTFSAVSSELVVNSPTNPYFIRQFIQTGVTAGTHTFIAEAWGAGGSGWVFLDFIQLAVVESVP